MTAKEEKGKKYAFVFDERLGIPLPQLHCDWGDLPVEERQSMILQWEVIRGHIPDRIKELEAMIMQKQEQIYREEDWERICALFSEINEYASRINDLLIWSRMQQDMATIDRPEEGEREK